MASPVFDTYWRFAAERHATYLRRLDSDRGPWTDDPIIGHHRFTNAFRAADRVSQFLISQVIFSDHRPGWKDQVFRTLLFKFFNKIETWQELDRDVGPLRFDTYDFATYAAVLDRRRDRGDRNYSAAYVIPPPRLGEDSKHRNHLRLLELMMMSDLPGRLEECATMANAFELLVSFPSVGKFLGFQFLIDLNYAPELGFSEMDFVVAGPGACDGIRKCFGAASDGIERDVIEWMAGAQFAEFERLGLGVPTLWGRPLQLIDIQNLFCEVDKYSRVAHPEVSGVSGRSRIKQVYSPNPDRLAPWFPPQWGVNDRIARFDLAEKVDAGIVAEPVGDLVLFR